MLYIQLNNGGFSLNEHIKKLAEKTSITAV